MPTGRTHGFAREARPRVVLVAAHPDDESASAGALLWTLAARDCEITVAHLTDGAPENMADARAHGFATRGEYAAAREYELCQALMCLPRTPNRFAFRFPDQSLAYDLGRAAEAVERLIRECRPSILLTHPYEGGHPDHDAAALISALAVDACGLPDPPRHFEFTSYHLHGGEVRTSAFLDGAPGTEILTIDASLKEAKERMLRCFVTQRETLRSFDAGAAERFRPAPRCDFRRPPHAPPVLYDLYDCGISSGEWCARASALLDARNAACR